MIAVSSIWTYDIVGTYFRPNATSKEIVNISRIGVALWTIEMGVVGLVFFEIGLSMGWLCAYCQRTLYF
jgi:Na+/proline symporter